MTLEIDLDSLTIDEVETLEEIAGCGIDAIGKALEDGAPKARLVKAFAYLTLKRQDPSVTLADVGRMPFSALVSGGVEVAEPRPTEASES